MRSLRSQLTLTFVAILLGVLVVVQLRAQSAPSSLDGKSVQDLTALIAELNRGNSDLQVQIRDEENAVAELQSLKSKGESAAQNLQSSIEQLQGWAGLVPITGPGVRVLLTGELPADAIEDVINEIWSLGADGVAVAGVRVVPGVVVSGAPNNLTIAGKTVAQPVIIAAVGDPQVLTGGLKRAGGMISVVLATYPGSTANIVPIDQPFELPATDHPLTPADAQPHL